MRNITPDKALWMVLKTRLNLAVICTIYPHRECKARELGINCNQCNNKKEFLDSQKRLSNYRENYNGHIQ